MTNVRKIQMAAIAAAVVVTMTTVAGASEAATRKATTNARSANAVVSALKARVADALVGIRYYLYGEDELFPSKAPARKLPRMTL